jgi:hypothetical protein
MSYLDRLRALDAKKHLPEQVSKVAKAPFDTFGTDQGKAVSPKIVPATVHPAFDPSALQAEADRRNARAVLERSTDRYCACGRLAESGYPDGRGGTVWRCWLCFPVLGRA